MRKSQRLQSECRWKYSLIRSVCFFWLARRGSILYSEVGNWWVQKDHTFSRLQIPPSTAVCSKEGSSQNKPSLLFHKPGPRHNHLETSDSSLRRHSQACLFIYLFSWELQLSDSQSKATRKKSGIVSYDDYIWDLAFQYPVTLHSYYSPTDGRIYLSWIRSVHYDWICTVAGS